MSGVQSRLTQDFCRALTVVRNAVLLMTIGAAKERNVCMSGNNLTKEQKDALCVSPIVAMQNLVREYEEAAQSTKEGKAHLTTAAGMPQPQDTKVDE